MKKYSFILILLIVLPMLFISCDKSTVKEPRKADTLITGITPDQTGWDVTVRFVDSSITKAILKAGRTRIFQKRYETILDEGLEVQFFSAETGRRVSRLTADSAIVDDKTKNMVAKGHVVIIADSSGTKLETSVLHWNNKTQKIYSTEYVVITSRSETLRGWGFESDQNLNNYKVFKVSGEKR
jgi:LPS export ABC transporter protein LptC